MNRIQRISIANDTLAISSNGHYVAQEEKVVNLAPAIAHCLQQTRLYLPPELEQIAASLLTQVTPLTPVTPSPAIPHSPDTSGAAEPPPPSTIIEVVNETTLCGARRLAAAAADPVGVLNFASARNPGGGFLHGAQAQEESLARSSALYLSQTGATAQPYYDYHRQERSLLYSDRAILSPACPIFRDDQGNLLAEPYLTTIITSAAPNAGAVKRNQTEELARIPEVFARRIHLTLALALHAGCQRLVLGAWGCGVFANDPLLVAELFRASLGPGGAFANRFRHVLFSVFDSSREQAVWRAFAQTLGG
jgi:uncharacterized protein (TIGR02452 family)